jgi:hypothetical protein
MEKEKNKCKEIKKCSNLFLTDLNNNNSCIGVIGRKGIRRKSTNDA